MAKYLLLGLAFLVSTTCPAKPNKLKQQIKLPPGFTISVFADNVPGARQMALSPDGIIFVGTATTKGKVYALRASQDYTKSLQRVVIAQDLYRPNGVAFRGDALYVAEVNKISRYQGISKRLNKPPKPSIVYDQLPNNSHHGLKYLRFGPDGKLYTGVGAPCNICKPEAEIFGSLIRLDPDGSNFEIIAKGIRNSVGFDWQPLTNKLFFTDNGRDYLGDDLPPEELNKIDNLGSHYGFPYCHAGTISDPKFGYQHDCKKLTPPTWTFKAHMAPLGIHFYRGTMFPDSYRNQLLVALHGSWNRSQPHGYKIALVRFEQGLPITEETFAEGWLLKNNVLGRPVDILELPDGSLLVSDNYQGVIYRISYQQP